MRPASFVVVTSRRLDEDADEREKTGRLELFGEGDNSKNRKSLGCCRLERVPSTVLRQIPRLGVLASAGKNGQRDRPVLSRAVEAAAQLASTKRGCRWAIPGSALKADSERERDTRRV